jgi:hypothetical protein
MLAKVGDHQLAAGFLIQLVRPVERGKERLGHIAIGRLDATRPGQGAAQVLSMQVGTSWA